MLAESLSSRSWNRVKFQINKYLKTEKKKRETKQKFVIENITDKKPLQTD